MLSAPPVKRASNWPARFILHLRAILTPRVYSSGVTCLCALQSDVEQCVYRVAQEAMTKVVRHAQAKLLRVSLRRELGALTLTIADDGRGFDPAEVDGSHYGLKGLRAILSTAPGIEVIALAEDGAQAVELVEQPGRCAII